MTYNPKTFGSIAKFVSEEDGTTLGAPLFSATLFVADTAIPQSQWDTIGPTGSGADHTWTALDALPASAEWIQLRIKHVGIGGSASSAAFSRIYLMKGGGTHAAASHTLSCEMFEWIDSGGNGYAEQITFPKVGVDANNIFQFQWVTSFTGDSIELWLVGYGEN